MDLKSVLPLVVTLFGAVGVVQLARTWRTSRVLKLLLSGAFLGLTTQLIASPLDASPVTLTDLGMSVAAGLTTVGAVLGADKQLFDRRRAVRILAGIVAGAAALLAFGFLSFVGGALISGITP
jgi:hypothetical protein